MRWVKHMTASHTDEKLCAVLDELGLEGYGFWWMLVEIVAGQINPKESKCSVTYSLPQWSRHLYCHHNKVSKYLGNLHSNGLVTAETVEGKVRVTIPNLLKYRDEYTRKSGQSPDNGLTINTDTDTEADTNTDTETDKKEESGEPETGSTPAVIGIPTIDGNECPITQDQIQEWQQAYPAVDVLQQLREMRAWSNANPAKKKTKRGIPKFIVGWLGKEQDKGGHPGRSPPMKPSEVFSEKVYTGTPEEKISWL